jgi:hypothetical protein
MEKQGTQSKKSDEIPQGKEESQSPTRKVARDRQEHSRKNIDKLGRRNRRLLEKKTLKNSVKNYWCAKKGER